MDRHQHDDTSRLNEQKIAALRGDLRALHEYLREQAERNVPQDAFSIDGRTFSYQAPLSLSLPVGCYVQIETNTGEAYLGQVITKEVTEREGAELGFELDIEQDDLFPEGIGISGIKDRLKVPALEGSGVVLSNVTGDTILAPSDTDTFQNASFTRADADLVSRYLAGSGRRATLPIGQASYVDGDATVRLDAGGFNRHTFLCGQSGSGKTFSLGIVLEQLLLETDLRIIVIDPNSDFVSLDTIRPIDEVNQLRSDELSATAYEQLAERYADATAGLHVFRPKMVATADDDILRVRFGDLSRAEQATVLRLDPLEDSAEFNTFWHILDELGQDDYSWEEVREAVAHNFTDEARKLGLRIENLGLADWEVWCSPGESSLIDTVANTDWRCLVVDIGTVDSAAEQMVVTNAILTHLWRERSRRRPTLVVIDEAHNICPQHPGDDLQAISTETAVRIAAEGRKFGLYLLLSTQRPAKIHENVLSQCENLLLMRMNSSSDLSHLADIFSHVPANLLSESSKFGLGETVLGGRFVQNPTFARFEGRVSVEGGSDIPSTWAQRRE
ncbi:ATP-binding protein [Haloferax sp. DFSO52]|uniref:ATP-binding protein n=1 Tax=Haloferax sp. DFSO52 TaxID=3388505 RepID=UPI003A867CF8